MCCNPVQGAALYLAVPKAPTVVVSVPITVKVPLFVAAPSVLNVSALVPVVGRAIET